MFLSFSTETFSQSTHYIENREKLKNKGYEIEEYDFELGLNEKRKQLFTMKLEENEILVVYIEAKDDNVTKTDISLFDFSNDHEEYLKADKSDYNGSPHFKAIVFSSPTAIQKLSAQLSLQSCKNQNLLNKFSLLIAYKKIANSVEKPKTKKTEKEIIKNNLHNLGYTIVGENSSYSPNYNDFEYFDFEKKENQKMCLILSSELKPEDIGEVIILDENNQAIANVDYSCDAKFLLSKFFFSNISGKFKLRLTLKSSVRYKLPYSIDLIIASKVSQIETGEFEKVIKCL